jgi:hypothetical protein
VRGRRGAQVLTGLSSSWPADRQQVCWLPGSSLRAFSRLIPCECLAVCAERAITCKPLLDRGRIILSDQGLPQGPKNGSPGQSAPSHHPQPTARAGLSRVTS